MSKVIYRLPQAVLKDSKQGKGADTGDRLPWPIDFYELAQYTNRNPYHCSCLQVKANCNLGLGYTVMGLSDAAEAQVEDRLSAVNPSQSLHDVLTKIALDYEIFGNAYLEVVRNKRGEVAELYHLPALLAWIRPQGAGVLYENEVNRQEYPHYAVGSQDSHSVLHFANYSPIDRHYGLPDWLGCLPILNLDYYATSYNQKFFSNSAMPDMAVVVEGGALDEAAEEAIVEFFQTNFKGLDNAHRTLFLPVGTPDVKVRFERLSTELRDGAFDRLLQLCRDRVISAHRVPPRLVGVSQPGSLGGTSEVFGQLSIFQDLVITPRQNYFAARLSSVIQDMGYPEAYLRFNTIDTTAQETDSDYYSKLVSAGILTINEARQELGYPELQEPGAIKANLSLVRSLQKLREAV